MYMERNEWVVDTLPKKHTKVLLDYLMHARACGGRYSPIDSCSKFAYTIEELKAELAKREHVPNKKEARKVRQEKAKRK